MTTTLNKPLTSHESIGTMLEDAICPLASPADTALNCTELGPRQDDSGRHSSQNTARNPPMDTFFVLRCFTGREKLACEQLAQQGIHALAPRTRTFERISRKRIVATDAPLFPGYLFARISDKQWTKLQEVPLVSRHPLMTDGRPHKLSAADVAYLQELALNPPRDPRDPRRIGVGDRVSVVAGPLQGIGGTVAALVGRHVQMLADVLGRLTISPDCLELAGGRS